MPIYAYRCSNCGHAQDVLQKISDPVLTVCPVCGHSTYVKQVTAAGFQLKGSGWYVTDFRGGDSKTGAAAPSGGGDAAKGGDKASSGEGSASSGDSKGSESSKSESSSSPSAAPASASSASPAPAPAPKPPGKSES